MTSPRPAAGGRRRLRVWAGAGAALAIVAGLAAAGLGGHGPSPAPRASRPATAAAAPGTAVPASPQPASAAPAGVPSRLAGIETRTPGDPLALGRLSAPVIMVEWADFQCPFCGQFARQTEPVLIRRYVDTGKLRIEWRDFPYLGAQSTAAALAARAAAAQGKFWAYHDALYRDQHPVNSGALTESYLVGLAARLGLDTARFRADMTSPATARAVSRDFQQGTALGVNGTPAFLIGRVPVFGAQPAATFEKVINTALAGAR